MLTPELGWAVTTGPTLAVLRTDDGGRSWVSG